MRQLPILIAVLVFGALALPGSAMADNQYVLTEGNAQKSIRDLHGNPLVGSGKDAPRLDWMIASHATPGAMCPPALWLRMYSLAPVPPSGA
jgi:hypothetical protein